MADIPAVAAVSHVDALVIDDNIWATTCSARSRPKVKLFGVVFPGRGFREPRHSFDCDGCCAPTKWRRAIQRGGATVLFCVKRKQAAVSSEHTRIIAGQRR
jgi:hypothetical protein